MKQLYDGYGCVYLATSLCAKQGQRCAEGRIITDPREIARLTKHLNIAEQRAPPKLKNYLPLAA